MLCFLESRGAAQTDVASTHPLFGVIVIRRTWTEDEIELLRKVYPTSLPEDLEAIFRKNRSTIIAKANSLKIRKSKEYLTSVRTRSLDFATKVRAEMIENNIVPEKDTSIKRRIATGIITIEGNVLTHRGHT